MGSCMNTQSHGPAYGLHEKDEECCMSGVNGLDVLSAVVEEVGGEGFFFFCTVCPRVTPGALGERGGFPPKAWVDVRQTEVYGHNTCNGMHISIRKCII